MKTFDYKNDYKAGDRVTTNDRSDASYPNGFPGTVLRVCEWSKGAEQALEVRLPGGVAIRGASDLKPSRA